MKMMVDTVNLNFDLSVSKDELQEKLIFWISTYCKELCCESSNLDSTAEVLLNYLRSYARDRIKLKVISISDIIKDASKQCIGYDLFTYKDTEGLLLLGWLRTKFDTTASSTKNLIVFRNDANELPCEILPDSEVFFNQLLFLPAWNLIYSQTTGLFYLEACKLIWPCLRSEKPVIEGSKDTTIISPVIAQTVSLSRNILGNATVNIAGQLSAKSELLRLKSKFYFLLELSDENGYRICIIVKEERAIHWHQRLQVYQDYVFYDLKRSSFTEENRYVFSLTLPSRWELANGCPHYFIPEKEWFKKLPMHLRKNVQCLRESVESYLISADKHRQKLISYKGIITSCDSCEKGLYELDKGIILHLLHLYLTNGGQGLRVGCQILVSNVHRLKNPEKDEIHLYCCSLSSIQIISFSSLKQPLKESLLPDSIYPYISQRLHLNPTQSYWLMDLGEKIAKQLCPSFLSLKSLLTIGTQDRRYGLFLSLFILKSPCLESKILVSEKAEHDVMDEFWNQPHKCCAPLLKSKWLPLYQFPSMKEVHDYINTNVNSLDNGTSRHIIYSEETNPPMILIGCLLLDPTSACIHLVDQSGTMDCLITDIGDGSQIYDCYQPCILSKQKSSLKQTFPCPYPQSWYLGHVIRIDKCQLVLEYSLCNSSAKLYLQFSMTNVVSLFCLSEKRMKKMSNLSPKGHKRKSVSEIGISKKVLIVEKTKEETGNSSIHCQLNSEEKMKTNEYEERSFIKYVFLLSYKHPLIIKSDNSEPKLHFYCDGYILQSSSSFLEAKKGSLSEFDMIDDARTDDKNCFVNFYLQGPAARWYPVLHNGCLYEITQPNSDTTCSSELNLPVEYLVQAIVLSPEVHFERLLSQKLEELARNTTFLKIQEFMLDCQHEKLLEKVCSDLCGKFKILDSKELNKYSVPVSLKCIVVERKDMIDKGKDGITIYLKVRDLKTDKIFPLYTSECFYHLGLFPGSILELLNVWLKISKYGMEYLYLTSLSLLTVKQVPDKTAMLPSPHLSLPEDSPQYGFIHDVLTSSGQLKFSCLGNIRSVQMLSLCYQSTNSSTTLKGETIYKQAIFVPKARIIVEDGSGRMVLYCTGKIIQTMLNLTDVCWSELENYVKQDKNILYNKEQSTSTGEEVIDKAINLLCKGTFYNKMYKFVCRNYLPRSSEEHTKWKADNRLLRAYCLDIEPIKYIRCTDFPAFVL